VKHITGPFGLFETFEGTVYINMKDISHPLLCKLALMLLAGSLLAGCEKQSTPETSSPAPTLSEAKQTTGSSQGGIKVDETPEAALFRELYEEIGLRESDVEIIRTTKGWLRYRLPKKMIRHNSHPICVGQKQKWYLLRMLSTDASVSVNTSSSPEFDSWKWVSYWYPLGQVVSFKREVYRRAMKELSSDLFSV